MGTSRCATGATWTSGGRGGPAAEVALVQPAVARAAGIIPVAAQISIFLLNAVVTFGSCIGVHKGSGAVATIFMSAVCPEPASLKFPRRELPSPLPLR